MRDGSRCPTSGLKPSRVQVNQVLDLRRPVDSTAKVMIHLWIMEVSRDEAIADTEVEGVPPEA